jgi:ATP-dependent Clp protease protease subunit
MTQYDCLYTIDVNSDEPIMLINKHIGFDADAGIGIMGDLFQKELLFLDTLGKKRIQIFINSVGGSVMDGMNIYSAILKTTTPVDTYNVGIAASTAGWIFAAGRKRYMADYAKLMMHNPYDSSDGDASKSLNEFQDSIITMLEKRCKMTYNQVQELMQRETWIDAKEAETLGLSDKTENSDELNKKRINAANSTKELWAISNSILKSKTINKMTNVAKKLGLPENATEADCENAIDALMVKIAKKAKNKAKNDDGEPDGDEEAMDKYKDMLATFNKTQKAELKEVADTLAALKAEAEASKNEIAKDKATHLVNQYVNRLGGKDAKPETIASWVAQATKDLAGTENLLKELPLNIAAVKVENTIELQKLPEGKLPTSALNLMAELKAKKMKQN